MASIAQVDAKRVDPAPPAEGVREVAADLARPIFDGALSQTFLTRNRAASSALLCSRRKAEATMDGYREELQRELAELEAQLRDIAGFVGFVGGANSGALMQALKAKIADIRSELEEMDDDA